MKIDFSNEELVQCNTFSNGCVNGDHISPFLYAKYFGITTNDCFEYTKTEKKCPTWIQNDVNLKNNFICPSQTARFHSLNTTFKKYYASKVKWIFPSETELMKEIFNNGPVVSSFVVPSDFDAFNFSSGDVFHSKMNDWAFSHVITIIGFGTHEITGEDYWLCENSWGPDWGLKLENDTAGFFKMPRTGHIYLDLKFLAFTAESEIEKVLSFKYFEVFLIGFLPLLIFLVCYILICFPCCFCVISCCDRCSFRKKSGQVKPNN